MAIANIPGISTLKMRAGYAVETTPGVAPTALHGCKDVTLSERFL